MPYVLKASCIKEVAQDDGGHSGDGQHRRNVDESCVIEMNTRSQIIGALFAAIRHAKVIPDCNESVKLKELAISCLQLGIFKMICTLE